MTTENPTQADIESAFLSMGYLQARQLESGEIAALCPFLFTVGLIVGLSEVSYRTRFCYSSYEEAENALKNWTGFHTPPGNYIKQKGVLTLIDEDRKEYDSPSERGPGAG